MSAEPSFIPAPPTSHELRARPPAGANSVVFPVVTGIVGVTVWGTLLSMIVLLTPKFEELFRDFGVAIPLVARWFIGLARVLSNPLALFGVALVMVAIIGGLSWLSSRARYATLALLLILLSLAVVVFVVYIIAMFVPTSGMASSMQKV